MTVGRRQVWRLGHICESTRSVSGTRVPQSISEGFHLEYLSEILSILLHTCQPNGGKSSRCLSCQYPGGRQTNIYLKLLITRRYKMLFTTLHLCQKNTNNESSFLNDSNIWKIPGPPGLYLSSEIPNSVLCFATRCMTCPMKMLL